MKTMLLTAALLLSQAVPVHGAGPRGAPASAQKATAADILPICERALEAALAGRDGKAVLEEAIKGFAEPDKQNARIVCEIYALGAVAALKHVGDGAPQLPAGGTTI